MRRTQDIPVHLQQRFREVLQLRVRGALLSPDTEAHLLDLRLLHVPAEFVREFPVLPEVQRRFGLFGGQEHGQVFDGEQVFGVGDGAAGDFGHVSAGSNDRRSYGLLRFDDVEPALLRALRLHFFMECLGDARAEVVIRPKVSFFFVVAVRHAAGEGHILDGVREADGLTRVRRADAGEVRVDRRDAVEDGICQQGADGAERLVRDGLPFLPVYSSQIAEVIQPGTDVGQSPLLIVFRDASADIDAGLGFQIPAVENGHVRGAAPDVEVRGHTAVLLGKGFRAGAAARQDGLEVRTRGGHDELAGQRAQLVDDDLGVLLE